MYDWVLDTPLDGFVQDAPQEEIDTAPVVESLTGTTWFTIELAVSSTTDIVLQIQFFVDVSPIEDLEYAALRKELVIDHRQL